MEGDGQEMGANEIAEHAEFKRKEISFPLKSEGRILMESPMKTYGSERSNWAVNDLSGLSPSMNETQTGIIVEELTVENYKTSSLSLANGSNNSRQGHWRGLHRLEIKSEFDGLDENVDHHVLLRAKEQLARMSYDEKHKSKDIIDQTPRAISSHLKATNNMAISSSNTLSVAAARLKSSSKPSFARVFSPKGLKGKGIVRKDPETCTISDNDQPCLLEVDRSGGTEPCPDGISLREWLEPGSRKKDKVESLSLFKQIVELVDSAHSQGIVLQDLQPSCLYVFSSNKIMYTGLSAKKGLESAVNNDLRRKRALEQGMDVANCRLGAKQLKPSENMGSLGFQPECTSPDIPRAGFHTSVKKDSNSFPNQTPMFRYRANSLAQSFSTGIQLEDRWYTCPEELNRRSCTFSSNIYSLGVLLFEVRSFISISAIPMYLKQD